MSDPIGRLLSFNVGMPKDVLWREKMVFTGVYKDPVRGPRHVGRLNIEGDGQGDRAGHGGEQRAVFVYQIESYRYWEHELGRDDFVYGQFGENFTIEGLADDEVCIGDRYQIGTAVFEVTQPRVTCYRVAPGLAQSPFLRCSTRWRGEHSDREIWWLHAARSRREQSFAKETRTLLGSLTNVRRHVYFSCPGSQDREGRDFDKAGRPAFALTVPVVATPPRFVAVEAARSVQVGRW